MPEWAPGVLEAHLAKVTVVGVVHLRTGLTKIASAVEAAAKADLSKTTHAHGTPSPAPKGGPPALVTGTGRRSIGHQYIAHVSGEIRIGTIAGVFPPNGRTPSSKYLYYQETLARFNHPFLRPAFERVIRADGVRVWLEAYKAWPRL